MDSFIAEQKASSDACHAKMLETRRTLDGLESQVLGLSDQYEAHHRVETANTIVLEEAMDKKKQADDDLDDAIEACKNNPANPLIAQYNAELLELRQIANPAVRSDIAHSVDYKEKARKYAEQVAAKAGNDQSVTNAIKANLTAQGISLSQFSDQQCRQFVSFLDRMGGNYSELDCNQTRAKLQDEFTVSYLEIEKLIQETNAQDGTETDDCIALAKNKHATTVEAINEEIKQATANILTAKAQMTALQSLLDEAKATLMKVQDHFKTLKEDCQTSGDVSTHLQKIRRLIEALDACPGRNDFDLQLPPR